MRRNYFSKIFLPLLAVTLLFAYCKKGDTGPAGATGAAGQPGGAGPTGPQGPQGDPGTANVIYSEWLDFTYSAFDTIHTPSGTGFTVDTVTYQGDITAAKLDSTILANGEIKVYFNFGSSAQPDVVPLPWIFPFDNGFSGTAYLTPDFFVGGIEITSNIDLSTARVTLLNGVKSGQYRYILVPGGTGARALRPNWKDYNAVKAFYGIKD
jgi:hypothetical protein